jgi:hypothetical protein
VTSPAGPLCMRQRRHPAQLGDCARPAGRRAGRVSVWIMGCQRPPVIPPSGIAAPDQRERPRLLGRVCRCVGEARSELFLDRATAVGCGVPCRST